MKQETRIFLLDESRILTGVAKTFFSLTNEFTLCGVAHDGCTGYEQIVKLKPEVLVLDVVLPLMDGITVLKLLKQEHPNYQPLIIVTSLLPWEHLAGSLLRLGTQYFLEKPYEFSVLCERIHMLLENRHLAGDGASIVQNRQKLLRRTGNILRRLGIPDKVVGFRYITEAVLLMHRLAPEPVMITKDIYPELAKQFQVSADTVEGSLRRCIRTVFRDNFDGMQKLFPDHSAEKPPSNAVFLGCLAALLQSDEMEWEG